MTESSPGQPTPSSGDQGEQPLPDPETLHRLLAQSEQYGALADPERRRAHVFESLANSEDPMWREIGQELRDGNIAPRELFRIDAYATKVEDGMAENAEHFHQSMRDAAAELQAEAEDQQAQQAPSPHPPQQERRDW